MKNILKIILAFTLAFTSISFGQMTSSLEQSSEKNYVPNGGFENGVAGWKAYKNTAGVLPITATGGTPAASISVSTSTPIFGKTSGILTKTAANLQGEGISYAFTVDPKSKGQVLGITGSYQINSGVYSGGSSGVDSDVEVYIYDVDAAQIIQPTGFKLDGGVIGYMNKINASFQTNISSTNYRLIFHIATTSASAYSLKLDDIKINAQFRPQGAVVTAMNSNLAFSSGITTNAVFTYKSRIVGDNIHAMLSWTFTGANTQAANGINLPIGIDANKIPSGNRFPIGQWYLRNAASGAVTVGAVIVGVNAGGNLSASLEGFNPSGNAPYTIAASFELGAEFTYPALGLDSSVQMSDGFDGRVIALSASISGTLSIATSSNVKVPWNTLSNSFDKTSALNLTNGSVTIQSAGVYAISGTLNFASTSAAYEINASLFVNGAQVKINNSAKTGTVAMPHNASYNFRQELKAGDIVEIYVLQTSGAALSLRSNASAPDLTNLNIEKLSGSATIAASEKVRMSYGQTSGQSFSSGVNTVIIHNIKEWDTHGIYNSATGEITFPKAGFGKLTISVLPSATGVASTMFFSIYKDNVEIRQIGRLEINTSSARNYAPTVQTIEVDGITGTKYKVGFFQNTGGALSLLPSNVYNFIQFEME